MHLIKSAFERQTAIHHHRRHPREMPSNKYKVNSYNCPFYLDISVFHGKLNKMYEKNVFSFPIVSFSFLEGGVPYALYNGIYISQMVNWL